MATVTKVRIGMDDQVLGTVRLTPDGITAEGKTTDDTQQLERLLHQMRQPRVYHDMTDAQFIADLPNRLRSRTWAQDITND